MHSAIQRTREEEGFTLIELLVVVIIIGILAAIAIPAFLNQRERAWESELTSTARNVALEVEAEATAEGGNYETAFPAASLTTDLQGLLTDLTGGLAPVDIAGTPTVSSTGFSFCMDHDQLIDAGAGNQVITYDSAAGGLQDLAASC